jgi:hypothetical protein
MAPRTVQARRYVTAFREGGSLPGLVEADDEGLYVVKFRGSAQGLRVLVAEWIAGELARAAGLRVPELVLLEFDPVLGRNEPDPELRGLLKASGGLNLGLDFLPGSVTFDPLAGGAPEPAYASLTVLFDAFVTNVDRTPRNPNLLRWHRELWLIDHGAALYFHHAFRADAPLQGSENPFPMVGQHVLLPFATELPSAMDTLTAALTPGRINDVVSQLPEGWLAAEAGPGKREYVAWLCARLEVLPLILQEAQRARARLV